MRVTFLGHATHLVEIDGVRVLTDPWLTDPIFEGLVEHDPPLRFGPGDLPPVDVVALTHAHLDHFNAPTLAALPDKSIPVVHPPVRFTELDRNLRLLGFSNLHPRRDWQPFELRGVRVIPTPSRGVLDECAYLIEGRGGRFWDGADAPQPPEVLDEIRARLGPVTAGAVSHNSFDQPALLGLDSLKPADHGPQGAVRAVRSLGMRAAIPGASNMRWRGADGEAITRKVIRRSHRDFCACLASEAPGVECLDLEPGRAWPSGATEPALAAGAPRRVEHDYIHAFLATGERWSPGGRPSTQETFERDLPARLRGAPAAALYVGQAVTFDVSGADAATYTVDFRDPGARPAAGDGGAPYAVRVTEADWKDLFERRLDWQVLLVSDRLRVTRFRPGPPPSGLHFAYALQAIFP